MARWTDDALRGAAIDLGIDIDQPRWEAAVYEFLLKLYGDAFDQSGDPLAPWQALQLAVHRGQPVPSWVLSYFADLAGRLEDVLFDASGKDEAAAVGRRLGFGSAGPGHRLAVKSGLAAARDVDLAIDLLEHLEGEAFVSFEAATALIAEQRRVSEATVKRAYRRHRDLAVAILINRRRHRRNARVTNTPPW